MRSVGDATLSFGQVPIPVKVYLAACATREPIHWISPQGNRVSIKYIDSVTGKEISRSEIRKGIEVTQGKYIALTRSEWDGLSGKKRKSIEVWEVVPPPTIPVYRVRKSYYLVPNKSDKAYRLLQRILSHKKYFMVGKWYTRTGRDYCIVIQPVGLSLLMSQVWYPSQCREEALAFDKGTEATPHEARLATSLLDMLVRPGVQWEAYSDEWQARLTALLHAKQGQLVDLERLLRKSLKRKR